MKQKLYRPFGAWRLLLAIFVMVQHLGINLGTSDLRAITAYWVPGTIAVPVFFALSGFVIVEAAHRFYAKRPLQFIANRALRILPLYFVTLAISIAAIAIALSCGTEETMYSDVNAEAISLPNIVAHLYALVPTQLPLTTFEIVPVFWAVRVEIVFYLAVGIAIAAARPLRLPFPPIILGMVLASAGTAIAFSGHTNTLYRLWASFAIQFAIGAAMYLACTWDRNFRAAMTALAGTLLGLTVCLSDDMFQWTVADANRLRITATFVAMLAFTFSLLLVKLKEQWERVDQRLGELSYPLYLLHIPVAILTKLVLGSSTSSVGVAAALSLVAAYFVNNSVERSVRRLRDSLRGFAIAPDPQPTLPDEPVRPVINNRHPIRTSTGDDARESDRSRVMDEGAIATSRARW
ncbi:acyltransferase family protein [Bradyrhizobium elkanii]|uniref:acyltransferase family protein n=1 Tax=Bradyrhizobium elkanii TaxID=29448 RepID=UPI003D20D2CC